MPRRGPAEPIAKAFGEKVRQIRQERGETLEQVAERLGTMDAKYLGEIERGWHSPTITTASRIASALHVGLVDLVVDL